MKIWIDITADDYEALERTRYFKIGESQYKEVFPTNAGTEIECRRTCAERGIPMSEIKYWKPGKFGPYQEYRRFVQVQLPLTEEERVLINEQDRVKRMREFVEERNAVEVKLAAAEEEIKRQKALIEETKGTKYPYGCKDKKQADFWMNWYHEKEVQELVKEKNSVAQLRGEVRVLSEQIKSLNRWLKVEPITS